MKLSLATFALLATLSSASTDLTSRRSITTDRRCEQRRRTTSVDDPCQIERHSGRSSGGDLTASTETKATVEIEAVVTLLLLDQAATETTATMEAIEAVMMMRSKVVTETTATMEAIEAVVTMRDKVVTETATTMEIMAAMMMLSKVVTETTATRNAIVEEVMILLFKVVQDSMMMMMDSMPMMMQLN